MLINVSSESFLLPHRAWKVGFFCLVRFLIHHEMVCRKIMSRKKIEKYLLSPITCFLRKYLVTIQFVQFRIDCKLLIPHQVRFVGESVDDVGGGYSESIAEMCEELQSGVLPLFILTPNGRVDNGVNRDCYLFNPAATSPEETNMFRFLGK